MQRVKLGRPAPLGLTQMERRVLDALWQYGTVARVADELSLSAETVRTHLRNARATLGVHNTFEAVALFEKARRKW